MSVNQLGRVTIKLMFNEFDAIDFARDVTGYVSVKSKRLCHMSE
jgi:hypothetical protein